MSTSPAHPGAGATPNGGKPAPGTPASSNPGPGKPGAGGFKRVRPRVDWKAVWPIPLALSSAALLAGGIFVGVLKMPKDDPALPLQQAGENYEQGRFAEALAVLNHDGVDMFNRGLMLPEQQLEFYTLRARSLYFGQEKLGIELENNYKRIIEAYDAAQRAGLKTTASDTGALANARLFLGETDKAVRLARSLAGVDETRRLRLYRKIVERSLRAAEQSTARGGRGSSGDVARGGPALELLAEMIEMPNLSLPERAWVVARQAELRLAAGYYEEASVRLLRDLTKFDELDRPSRAELMFLLGKSYMLAGKGLRATDFLEAAEADLPEFDDRRAESRVLRGQLLAAQGDAEGAREQFERVVDAFDQSPQQLAALVGLGDAEAALGNAPGALKAFREAIRLVAQRGPKVGVDFDLLGQRLLAKAQDRLLQNEPGEALAFATLSQEALRRLGPVPAPVNIALAVANRASAERIIADAGGTGPGVDWSAISDVSATEAKGFLIDAGISYRQHARQMTIADYQVQMDSLWNAGESFDRAGDTEAAIEAFSSFVQGARTDFPRRAEAIFRLAQVYESRGEFGTASRLYEQLVAQRESRDSFAGVWADRSLVPLARCYMLGTTGESTGPVVDVSTGAAEPGAKQEGQPPAASSKDQKASGEKNSKPAAAANSTRSSAPTPDQLKERRERLEANQARAVQLLSSVVDGGALLEPDAQGFVEALSLLGELHYARGEYEPAVERLRQTLQRAGPGPTSVTVRYKLADSHRRLALAGTGGGSNEPLSQRAVSEATRQGHLEAAERLYREVVSDLARKPAARVTAMEALLRRNSLFYAADCVYLAGRYAEAVRHYLAARDQYPQDPASMVAMTQTVSALVKLERWDEARTVHERAKVLLTSIPDEVWSDPARLLPMERRHWEAWLDSKMQIERLPAAPALTGAGAARQSPP